MAFALVPPHFARSFLLLPFLSHARICRMQKIVPLISSGTAGPLGVYHLPRLWLKVSLSSKDLLAEGYPAIGTGFDQMVLDGLGLNRDAVTDFIKQNHPSYPEFEAWVCKQPGAKVDAESIKKLNAALVNYHHDGDTRTGILSTCRMKDEGKILDAIHLNELDDWQEFHRQVLA